MLWDAMGFSSVRQAWMAALLASFLALFVLASTVEAATCAPETVTHASATLAEVPSDPDDDGRSDQHAICSHGHCHHSGVVVIVEPDLGLGSLNGRELQPMPPTDVLVSSAPAGLDRPPQS